MEKIFLLHIDFANVFAYMCIFNSLIYLYKSIVYSTWKFAFIFMHIMKNSNENWFGKIELFGDQTRQYSKELSRDYMAICFLVRI